MEGVRDRHRRGRSEHLLDEIRDIMDAYEAGAYVDYQEAFGRAVRDRVVNHFKTKNARLHRMLGV